MVPISSSSSPSMWQAALVAAALADLRPSNSISPQAASDPWPRNSRRSIMVAFSPAYGKQRIIVNGGPIRYSMTGGLLLDAAPWLLWSVTFLPPGSPNNLGCALILVSGGKIYRREAAGT